MEALCCCFGVCCSEAGAACTKLIGTRKATQLGYIMLIVFLIIPVVGITYLLDKLNKLIDITPSSIVLRMSLALFVFFFIMLILMLCRNKVSQVINEGLFCTKYFIIVAFFVGALFLPTAILDIYSSIARISSIIYLVIQVVILIDLYYLVAIRLKQRYDSGQTCCGGCLIGLTITVQVLALLLNILAYVNFSSDSCGSTTWLSVITTCLIVILPIIQLVGCNSQSSLVTTALVTLTISYFSFAAQEYFKTGCIIRLTPFGYAIEVSISLLLFALTTYGTVMGGFSENQYQGVKPQQISGKEGNQLKQVSQDETTLDEYSQNWGWIRWHFYICLGVMYLGMIFTNWQSTDRIGQNLQGYDFVFWLKAVISWFMVLVYVWTLVAPRIFPDRNFTIE